MVLYSIIIIICKNICAHGRKYFLCLSEKFISSGPSRYSEIFANGMSGIFLYFMVSLMERFVFKGNVTVVAVHTISYIDLLSFHFLFLNIISPASRWFPSGSRTLFFTRRPRWDPKSLFRMKLWGWEVRRWFALIGTISYSS